MKKLKILIAVATWDRPNVTKLCLENLQKVRDSDTVIVAYDDCSRAYDVSFLDSFCDGILRFRLHGGIERSRARAIRDFIHRYTNFDILYLTDNDTIHDPAFVDILREFFSEQETYPFAHPVGLFRSVFHEDAIEEHFDSFIVSKTCPGVSQAYNREMAEKIVTLLNTNPVMETVYGWDYHWPASLERPFLITKNSYVEHIGRDLSEGGIHCPNSGPSRENFHSDFRRDRAKLPTVELSRLSEESITKLFSGSDH